ncbi:Carboxylesterase NlhH [Lachnellula suecica]|uniref:Carboxylesterase NlhH n=1 Tax=Lachnellula suecica TaxID=602035 RepID=A0A8T9C357_9HELO|nr:Carboxylesterase NlhH [Lachnellula suecica]
MATPKAPYDPEMMGTLLASNALPPNGPPPPPTKETIADRRKLTTMWDAKYDDPSLSREDLTIPGPDGNTIELTIVKPNTPASGPRNAIYYIHGGGMILATRHFMVQGMFPWVKSLDAVIITVEYRLAPEHPHPAPVEDCYAGLKWVTENSTKLGINNSRIMIAGHSAGGGLAAGTALLARDRNLPVPLFAQFLIYPMLDDRTNTASCKQYMNEGTWPGKNNIVAWDWLLPSRDVPGLEYAAPSRATNVSNLPQTYLDVGSADLFRDEGVAYASKLWEQGVQAELHVWPGAYHGFDAWSPTSDLAKTADAARTAWLKRIFIGPPPKAPAGLL